MLKIRRRSKSYGAFSALSAVGFTAATAKGTALLGESSAGKSTLVKVLLGL